MKVEVNTSFIKQFDKSRQTNLKESIKIAIESVINAKQLSEVPNIKKLKGSKTAYRIRVGDFRIGIIYDNNIVYFWTFDHRKDIYKNFP